MYANTHELRAAAASLDLLALEVVGTPGLAGAPSLAGCLGETPEANEAASRAEMVTQRAQHSLSELVRRLRHASDALLTTANRFDRMEEQLAMIAR